IFPGRDGWEIEVRRELPAPWAWCADAMGSEFLSCKGELAIAKATPTRCDVYTSRHAPVFESFTATSLAEARERAEDECW
ncbi:hypothetical protein LAJ57_13925, partial [Streptococcus pneumoniae]|uniref:hypothetical protein n=1 Tax=Streptococcus pneumoniae TaxID=1313 RepID=UPI001CBFA3FF